jgi:hypothetical protein
MIFKFPSRKHFQKFSANHLDIACKLDVVGDGLGSALEKIKAYAVL